MCLFSLGLRVWGVPPILPNTYIGGVSMEEMWKTIPGYENYEASNLGRIRHKETKKIKHLRNTFKGYLQVSLYKNGDKTERVHRLIALTFIPNIENKPQINHIDCNKQNNRVDNLEWVSNEENFEHAKNNGLLNCKRPRKPKKKEKYIPHKIKQFDLENNFIREWKSISEIIKELEINNTSRIYACCNNKRKQAYNFKWSY